MIDTLLNRLFRCHHRRLTPRGPDCQRRAATSRSESLLLKLRNETLDAVAGGWNLMALETARSGAPFSIGGGYANLGDGDSSRADLVGNPGIANPSPAAWFNTAAFQKPALYTFGSAPLGILDGPGFVQFNTALSKNFRLAERKELQFRGEAFNAFNHVNYGSPNTNIASSLFGRITSASTARYMQLGLKLAF